MRDMSNMQQKAGRASAPPVFTDQMGQEVVRRINSSSEKLNVDFQCMSFKQANTKMERRRVLQGAGDRTKIKGRPKSHLAMTIELRLLAVFGRKPEGEYRFHPERRWRFDFAYPDLKIAVEAEGGVFGHGRHTRGMGYVKDCEKYNQAVLLGWRVFRYTIKNYDQINKDFETLKGTR